MEKNFKLVAAFCTFLVSATARGEFSNKWGCFWTENGKTITYRADCGFKDECFYYTDKWHYDDACDKGNGPPKSQTSEPKDAGRPVTPTPPPAPDIAKIPMQANDWKNCAGSSLATPEATVTACSSIINDLHTTPDDFAMATSLIADAYNRSANYQMAIKMSNFAIQSNPDLALPYYSRGQANFQLDQYQKAIDDFTRGMSNFSKPTHTSFQGITSLADYYNNRALAYKFLQNKASAAKDYRRALAIDPNSSYAKHRLSEMNEPEQPGVSNSCIALGSPVPGGVGCAPGKQWFWTTASIRRSPGCPSSMLIEYLAPDTGQFEEMSIPARLQTCGAGISVARSKE